MVERPADFCGWSSRKRAFDRASRVTVTKNAGGGEHWVGEARRDDNVVVLSWLVGCDKHGVRLTDMNVERGIRGLKGMCSLHFNKLHLMSLNSEVEGMLQPHI